MRSSSVDRAVWLEDEFWLARARSLARGRQAALLLVREGRLIREVSGTDRAVREVAVREVAARARVGTTAYVAADSRGVSRVLRSALADAGARVVGAE